MGSEGCVADSLAMMERIHRRPRREASSDAHRNEEEFVAMDVSIL